MRLGLVRDAFGCPGRLLVVGIVVRVLLLRLVLRVLVVRVVRVLVRGEFELVVRVLVVRLVVRGRLVVRVELMSTVLGLDAPAVGVGWRPEIDLTIERLTGVEFVEVIAENVCADHLPESLRILRGRGVRVVPHGVGLGLGGAELPSPARLSRLAEVAAAVGAPLVSEHVAFVRAGGLEAGHLLPVPYTRDALAVVAENVRVAQDNLPVPLALENPATLFTWPDNELTQGQFLAELVERTGAHLLVDVANLHTRLVNHGVDPRDELRDLPLEAVAYVHVAGGLLRDGLWHDTHAHPVTEPVLEVLATLCALRRPPGILLERDANHPPPDELAAELATIRRVADLAAVAA